MKDPKIRPAPCVAPKRKVGVWVRVRVQTFPQYPKIVSDVFSRSPDPDRTVKRGGLRAQLPPEREKWLLAEDLKTKRSGTVRPPFSNSTMSLVCRSSSPVSMI